MCAAVVKAYHDNGLDMQPLMSTVPHLLSCVLDRSEHALYALAGLARHSAFPEHDEAAAVICATLLPGVSFALITA